MVKDSRERGHHEVGPPSLEAKKPVEKPLYEDLGFDSQADMDEARARFAEITKEQDMAKADKLKADLLESFIAKAEHTEGGGNAALRLQIDQGKEYLAKIAAETDPVKADRLRSELQAYQNTNDEILLPEGASEIQSDARARERIAELELQLGKGREVLLSPNAADETEAESQGRRRYENADMIFRSLDRPAKPSAPIAPDDKTPVMRKDGKKLG
jgi:hypothetical protein